MSNRGNLLRAYKTGNFLDTVYGILSGGNNDWDTLAQELVVLHNEGFIDIVRAFAALKNNSSIGPAFFQTRHVFEKILPDLDALVSSVMECVLHLYRSAGKDMFAGTIFESFIDFCSKKTTRPHEALKEIETNPEKFATILPAALIAGSYIDIHFYLTETIRFCREKNVELKSNAIFSIGKLKWPDGVAVPDSAIDELERSLSLETEDQILANIVSSAFALLLRDKSKESRTVALIATTLSKGGDCTLHAASELFGFHTAKLPCSLLEVLMLYFQRIKPTNKGTVDNVDYGISHLIKKGCIENALQLLEYLLLEHPQELTISVFDRVAREIFNNKALLGKILTRWFLHGNRALCDGVNGIFNTPHSEDLPLVIDPSELIPIGFANILFVARKTIGYLFNWPISAASILISLMGNAKDDETLKELGNLLFDPLLINFPGKVRDYVREKSGSESGNVKATIDNALKSIDDYLDDLQSVGDLVALYPGETKREAYRRYFSHLSEESYKKTEAQSPLLSLFSKSVLLYGRKSINYVYGFDGTSKRVEFPLQSLSTEIEFPRLEVLDPYGLDYMLRVFRNE